MDFSDALYMIKQGYKMARAGWNCKDMFIFLVRGSTFEVNRPPLSEIYPEGTSITYHAHIDLKTAQGYVIVWNPSHADLMADDWCIVE